MTRTFTLELTLKVDVAQLHQLIEIARSVYSKSGSAVSDHGHPIPAEEFVSDAESAILELAHGNGWFEKAGVEMIGATCGEAAADRAPREAAAVDCSVQTFGDLDDPSYEPALDEFETGVYLYRWPNGDFSLVTAPSRREALEDLDELGMAVTELLVPMDSCMADFRLSDDGKIELQQFGENTADHIWNHVYPVLNVAQRHAPTGADGQFTLLGKEMITKSVEQERTRLLDNQPTGPEADTNLGRRMQHQADMAGPVADQYVRRAAKKILESNLLDKEKPN